MYKIIIFGTGKTAEIIRNALNNKVSVLCYLDNNKEKWNHEYCGKIVYDPDKIHNFNYDFILIASQFNDTIYEQLIDLKVDKKKILQFYKYIDSYNNYIYYEINDVQRKNPDVVATGISYMCRAIESSELCKSFFNLANPSQDLYFDYEIIKFILENHRDRIFNLKYLFIGLSYYSFEYDLSKSSMKGKVLMYYKKLGKYNNFKDINDISEIDEINMNIGIKIFRFNRLGVDIDWNQKINTIHEINDECGKRQALLDSNKNYPETVKENKEIFKKYLQLLKENNIKPIVIVCPTSKYYSKYFPKRLKDQFYTIINETRKQYDFQFLDYFDSELFEDNDFYDVSHLNDKGAEKFTKLLNEKVKW